MFPKEITLNHFITALNEKLKDKKVFPGEGIPVDQCKTLNQDKLSTYVINPYGITDPAENYYLYVGAKNLYGLEGKVFVYRNMVYKIKTVINKSTGTILAPFIFIMEEYTDPYVEELRARFEKIKQHLLVCTDCIEELGGLSMSKHLREQEKKWMLEDLV